MAVNEERVQKLQKVLGLDREQALQLIADDAKVDKMKSAKEINSDLTAEQQKIAKQARQADRKKTVYKFDTTKRAKKENTSKRSILENLREAVEANGATDIEVTNIEREFVFLVDGVKYKVTLSAPRS